jgi:transcriptional regulator with XRE-family HTH domain
MRRSIGLTQRELSARSGVHVQLISRYERDVSVPTLDSAVDVADALGCSIDQFLQARKRNVAA